MRTHETVIYAAAFPSAAAMAPDSAGRVRGEAIIWGALSEDRGGYYDRFPRGAMRPPDDVRALLSHDASVILGRTTANTLQLHDEADGLYYTLDVADTQAGRDVLKSIKRGDLTQCSFSALVEDEDWDYDPMLRAPVRTVLKFTLLEISIVPIPAFSGTSAKVVEQ